MQIKNYWVISPNIFNVANIILDTNEPKKHQPNSHAEIINKIDSLIKNGDTQPTEPVSTLHNNSNMIEIRTPLQKKIQSTRVSSTTNRNISSTANSIPDELKKPKQEESNFRFIQSLDELSISPEEHKSAHIEFIDLPIQNINFSFKIKNLEPHTQHSLLEKPTHLDLLKKTEIINIPNFSKSIDTSETTMIHEPPLLKNKKANLANIKQSNQFNLRPPQQNKKRIRFSLRKKKNDSSQNEKNFIENNQKTKLDQLYYVSSVNTAKSTKSDDVDSLQKELERVQREIQEKQRKLKQAEQKAREQKLLAEKQRREELQRQKEEERLAKKQEQERLKEKKKREREKLLKQKQKEREQLLKQKEAERLAKKQEQERLIQQALKEKEQKQLEKEQKKQSKSRIKVRRHPPPQQPTPTSEVPPQENTQPKPETKIPDHQEPTDQPKPTLVAKIEEAKKSKPSDPEVIEVLNMLDKLLADLPEDTIQDFAKSKNFAKYEKVMRKYKQK